jgi:hypothetical protein
MYNDTVSRYSLKSLPSSAFMDELEVVSERNKGTTVVMKKRFVD